MDNKIDKAIKNEEIDKIELSKDEMLKLLSCLEAKLQGSEIAIAALKVDRLKRLFYPAVIKHNYKTKNKINRNSLNYATIIPSNKIPNKTEKDEFDLNSTFNEEETILDSNLETKLKSQKTVIETNLDLIDDDLNKDLDDDENDIKNDNLFPNDKYNEYHKHIETNPYLALAGDLKYAYDNESHETLITKVYNSKVLRIKQLIQEQQNARKFLENQLNELSNRYKNVVDELEIEKDKNIKFKRDDTIKKFEKTEKELEDLKEELNNLKKEYETEKEREKVMIVYLLSERKQLIIRLIEESEKNTELVNLLSTEKNRSAEIEEGLEEESKRSLQMEIDLECLTNKYENEKGQLEERIKLVEKKNKDLEDECQKLKQKLKELFNSNSNNNNPITANKNAITNLTGSTIVNNQQIRQIPNVVQSLQQSKPSLAAKPSFDSLTNGKPVVTIINTTGSFNQPVRSNSVTSRINMDQSTSTKTISTLNKLNSSLSTANNNVNSNNNNLINNTSNITNNISIPTESVSVASVIQKFSNTISNNIQPQPQPIQRKLSSSGLVANIAQSISQSEDQNRLKRGPPPIPQKPTQINPQLLKERSTAAKLEQTTNQSN